MAKTGINIKGLDKLERKFKKYPQAALQGLKKGLFQEAEGIMNVSKNVYVPVDVGTLKSSGHVKLPIEVTMHGVTVTMGYGGPAAPYALKVHEDLNAFHPSGQAKYLEVPFKAAKKGMGARVSKDIDDEIKKVSKG